MFTRQRGKLPKYLRLIGPGGSPSPGTMSQWSRALPRPGTDDPCPINSRVPFLFSPSREELQRTPPGCRTKSPPTLARIHAHAVAVVAARRPRHRAATRFKGKLCPGRCPVRHTARARRERGGRRRGERPPPAGRRRPTARGEVGWGRPPPPPLSVATARPARPFLVSKNLGYF